MRPNKLTPQQNVRWESSRMMLPEHREALLHYYETSEEKEKPELDEQQTSTFARYIHEAYIEKTSITVSLFHPSKNEQIKGTIVSIDSALQRLKLMTDEGPLWIEFNDLVDVYF